MSHTLSHPTPRFWAIVPAAGCGTRMASATPKQYLYLGDKPLLVHTLMRLLGVPAIEKIVLALSPQDKHWQEQPLSHNPRILTTQGGGTRAESVVCALNLLVEHADSNDWVLVHDAARPCVTRDAIEALIAATLNTNGGLLALPVSDTLKRAHDFRVSATVDRSALWAAQTPQLFPITLLRTALARAADKGQNVTDEASAMELAGFAPLLVEGRSDNIKVTLPSDLQLAQLILQQQSLGE